jgi:hypothetical protein
MHTHIQKIRSFRGGKKGGGERGLKSIFHFLNLTLYIFCGPMPLQYFYTQEFSWLLSWRQENKNSNIFWTIGWCKEKKKKRNLHHKETQPWSTLLPARTVLFAKLRNDGIYLYTSFIQKYTSATNLNKPLSVYFIYFDQNVLNIGTHKSTVFSIIM